MAANTRTPAQIEADRLDIERRHLRLGQTVQQIADVMGMTRQLVSYDLAQIKEQWRVARLATRDEHVERELARVGVLEREYWEAYARSRHDAVTVTTERLAKGASAGDDAPDLPDGLTLTDLEPDERDQALAEATLSADALTILKQIEKRTGQVGAPAYLAGVQWASEARRKLLGLDAPTKIAPTTPSGDKPYEQAYNMDGFSVQEIRAIIARARSGGAGDDSGDGSDAGAA